MWTDGQNACDFTYPIGSVYIQYPDCKEPNLIYGLTTWTELKFGGAFFRTEGGNSKAFTNSYEATDNGAKLLTFSGTDKPYDGTVVGHEKDGIKVGDFLAYNDEYREVTAVTASGGVITSLTLDNSFTDYANLSFVYIVQADSFQGHFHELVSGKNDDFGHHGEGNAVGHIGFSGNTSFANRVRNALTNNNDGTPRYGKETKPLNITVRLWKRIS